MKSYHFFPRFLFTLMCIALVIAPVSANIRPHPIASILYIENNGVPFNESINFSLKCYGHFAYPTDTYTFLREKTADDPNPPAEIFSLSGICSSYGCLISTVLQSPPGRYMEPEHSDLCKFTGTAGGMTFETWNVTRIGGIQCFKYSDQWDVSKNIQKTTRYYNYTPGYLECRKKLKDLGEECQQYLVNNSLKIHTESMTHNQCIDLNNREEQKCEENLEEIDPSKFLPVEKYCLFRFSIPIQNQTIETTSVPIATAAPQSPVTSLYCTLMNFFGARC